MDGSVYRKERGGSRRGVGSFMELQGASCYAGRGGNAEEHVVVDGVGHQAGTPGLRCGVTQVGGR